MKIEDNHLSQSFLRGCGKILFLLFSFNSFILFAQTNSFPTTGNVGIGTTSPTQQFEINMPAHTSGFKIGSTNGNTRYLELGSDGYNQYLNINAGTFQFRKNGSTISIFDTSGIFAPSGLETSPGISFKDNVSVGFYHAGGGTESFSAVTNGLSRMTWAADGRIGIGTVSPTTPLHIKDGNEQLVTFESSSSTANLNKLFFAVGRGGQYPMGYGILGGYDLTGERVDYIQLTKGPTYKSVRFLTSAEFANNTGVTANSTTGATVPIFHFSSGNEVKIGPQYSQPFKSTYYIGDNTVNYDWKVFSTSATLMSLTGSGNLGIGITTPTHKLEVKDSSPSPAFLINNIGNDRRQAIAIQNTNAGTASVAVYKMYNASSGTGAGNGADIGLTNSGYDQINYGAPGGNSMVVWNYENGNVVFGTNNSEKLRIDNLGNVGIGINSPNYKLDVNGAINASSILINGVQVNPTGLWTTSGLNAFYDSGNIGIGISNPQNKLDVNGTVHAKEVKVDLNNWPDYVFERNYKLCSLDELKNFIERNQHLPDLPSATEVKTDGIMLGEMNALLLKKIEEMTLYILEQNGVNKNQAELIQKMEKRLEILEAELHNKP